MDNWNQLVLCACSNYELSSPRVEFIRHNENLTYKVIDATGAEYVLRIHKPVAGFAAATAQHSHESLTAEMDFIQAIGRHTDIPVQRPVADREGQLVTCLEGGVQATLLTWIEGQAMHHEDPDWAEQAHATGLMTAKLHNFAAGWQPARPLARQSYDWDKLHGALESIGQGVDMGLIAPHNYDIVQEGGERIAGLMAELDRLTDVWGMVHADLNKTNLIVHRGHVSPIDFCLCGYGYFYMDLGGTSADFGPLDVRRSYLAGYRAVRSLPEADIKYIEGFFVMSIMLFMATHLHNPKVQEWFGRRMQPICDDYITPLVQGERFYENI